MRRVIPIAGVPIERFNININRTLYTFFLYYNARFDFWVVSLSINDISLFDSFKIVQGVDIGGIFNIDIGGRLFIDSVTENLDDPTRNDLGTDKLLIYDDTV